MATKGLNTVYSQDELDSLNSLIDKLDKADDAKKQFENELLGIQISNAEKLYEKKKALLLKEETERIALEDKIKTEKELANVAFEKRKQQLEEEFKKASAKAADNPKLKEKIKKEYKDKTKQIKEEQKLVMSGIEARIKKEDAYAKKQEERQKASEIIHDKTLTKQERINKLQVEMGLSAADATNTYNKAKTQENIYAAYTKMANFAKQLESTITNIAESQSAIDTRLQGSNISTRYGSYWKQLENDVVKYVGMSPIVKQSAVVDNLKSFIGKGIAFNVEQRAFLDTISDKIANTFNAADGTLLRLVRIQQEDTTAARLGMESALTSFLNNMYETTEYMSEMAEGVRQNLYSATALMTAKSATEFEYQIQKWMGSLYSVGFGTDLSSALGNLAAGNISSISDGGLGNLLVMAANKSNLSIAEILADGLDASNTNKLMQAMVDYLGQIYTETKGSNILAQQYAGVFGLTAADLKAAANLSKTSKTVAGTNYDYNKMMNQLYSMAGTMWKRTSTGEMMTNLFDNLKFATASSMANNPVLYTTYTLANMLTDTTGGIDFSLPTVMGNGMAAQTFNVADIMRVATLGAGLLGGIGTMLSGLGNNGSATGMLKGFGIGTTTVARSESGTYVGNGSGSDVQNKAMTDTTDSANQQTVSAQEENTAATTTDINENVVAIYTLLNDVVNGSKSLHVDIDDTMTWTMTETGAIGRF